ncbi:hypothetical protein [Nocardia sp. NPDC005366]|uniref:hypothetical protein n=1 Tax=Nocardia sp. NPDC005366 TaxID=3156878 RepID=UPI0033B95609
MTTPETTQSHTDEKPSIEHIAERRDESRSGHRQIPPARTWRDGRTVLAVLAALLVASATTAGVLGWRIHRDGATDRAAAAALAAGQQYAVVLTSIDASHIDRDFAAIDAGATGAFKQMYAQSAVQLQPLLVQARSVSKGRVLSASVQSASRERVVLMMFVDAEVTNATTTGPRVDRSRILMTMDDVDGRWLASEVEIL